MADPPRLTKLGAKWVEVTVECEAGRTSQGANLKRGQQHPWKESLRSGLVGNEFLPTRFLIKGAAGVGQPFRVI